MIKKAPSRIESNIPSPIWWWYVLARPERWEHGNWAKKVDQRSSLEVFLTFTLKSPPKRKMVSGASSLTVEIRDWISARAEAKLASLP